MTHKERMEKMKEYDRSITIVLWWMYALAAIWAAVMVYLNVDMVLYFLGK